MSDKTVATVRAQLHQTKVKGVKKMNKKKTKGSPLRTKDKSTDTDDEKNAIIKRLDGMLSLMIEQLHQNNTELNKIYNLLYQTGLTPTEIGKIVGKPRTQVNAMISQCKKED